MTSTMNNAKQSIMNALDSYCNRRENSLFDVTYDLKEKANMSQSDYMELKDLAHNLRDYAKVNASWPTKLAWKIEDLKNKCLYINKHNIFDKLYYQIHGFIKFEIKEINYI